MTDFERRNALKEISNYPPPKKTSGSLTHAEMAMVIVR